MTTSNMTLAERILAQRAAVDAAKAALASAIPAGPAPAKFKPQPPLCGCGCGIRTSGGTYRPGHDAKHKSILFKLADNADPAISGPAIELLEAKNWLYLKAIAKEPSPEKLTRALLKETAIETEMRLTEVYDEAGFRA